VQGIIPYYTLEIGVLLLVLEEDHLMENGLEHLWLMDLIHEEVTLLLGGIFQILIGHKF
jgi:hypothetical protein